MLIEIKAFAENTADITCSALLEKKPLHPEQKELAALQNTDYNSASVGALAQLVEQRTLNP